MVLNKNVNYILLCVFYFQAYFQGSLIKFKKSLLNFRRDQPEGWEIVCERRNWGGRRGGGMEREEGEEEK